GLANVAGLSYGTFTSVSVTGLGFGTTASYSALFSDVIGASSPTPGTLTVYVTLDGAQLPVRPPPWGHPSGNHRPYSKHSANRKFRVTRLDGARRRLCRRPVLRRLSKCVPS